LKYPRGSKELDQFDCCIVVLLSARMDQSSMHQKLDPMQNEIVQYFPLFFSRIRRRAAYLCIKKKKKVQIQKEPLPRLDQIFPFWEV